MASHMSKFQSAFFCITISPFGLILEAPAAGRSREGVRSTLQNYPMILVSVRRSRVCNRLRLPKKLSLRDNPGKSSGQQPRAGTALAIAARQLRDSSGTPPGELRDSSRAIPGQLQGSSGTASGHPGLRYSSKTPPGPLRDSSVTPAAPVRRISASKFGCVNWRARWTDPGHLRNGSGTGFRALKENRDSSGTLAASASRICTSQRVKQFCF